MRLKTYVLNLDRHPDRLARVAQALNSQGVEWERFPAIDAQKVGDAALDALVAPRGPIPRFPKGARACTASHFAILCDFLASNAKVALVLEDDAVISSRLKADLETVLDLFSGGVLNLNRQTPHGLTKKLVVRARDSQTRDGLDTCDLVGVHYGTAGFLIDRDAARKVLELYPLPDLPIDHIYFNPNVSRLVGKVKVGQLFPALVKPREGLTSTIQGQPVTGTASLRSKLRRLVTEVAIAPRLLAGVAFGTYKVRELEFKE